jgi:hypothetical protein
MVLITSTQISLLASTITLSMIPGRVLWRKSGTGTA